jgi:hypothetical protein
LTLPGKADQIRLPLRTAIFGLFSQPLKCHGYPLRLVVGAILRDELLQQSIDWAVSTLANGALVLGVAGLASPIKHRSKHGFQHKLCLQIGSDKKLICMGLPPKMFC